MSQRTLRSPLIGAAIAALCSGMAALSYEVLWTRRMTDLTGADAASVARVLGCFFLGLALGAAAMSYWGTRVTRPWITFARFEVGIALLSLPILFLPTWTSWIWPALGSDGLTSLVGVTTKVILSGALVLTPSLLMGATLPLLIAGLQATSMAESRDIVRVYAVNTLGGAVGIALVMLGTLSWLGVAGALFATTFLNLAAAGLGLWIDRRAPSAPPPRPEGKRLSREVDNGRAVSFQSALLLSFLTGFVTLAFEISAIEMIMLVAPMSLYAPAIILFCVILCLAFSGFVVAQTKRWFRLMPESLSIFLATAGVLITLSPVIFMWRAVETGGVPPTESFNGFLMNVTQLAMVAIGAALLTLGVVFPLILRATRIHPGTESNARRQIPALLAFNGFGGLVGAETMFGILLPTFGIYPSIGIIGALACFIGLAMATRATRETRVPFLVATGALTTIALFVGLIRLPKLDTVNPHMELKVIDQSFGREGALAVVERGDTGRALLVSNQYLLGSVSAKSTQERQTHLPLLLHPQPSDVAFIGVATGISPGAATLHAAVDSITAIEISKSVLNAAREQFGDYNHDVLNSEKVQVVQQDGRAYLAASRDRFDVVVGDLFLPWGSGVGRLYSLEHFRSVRNSLKDGGVFCQWLPMFQLTPEQFQRIENTFAQVFPESHLFYNSFQSSSPALALVGWNGGDYSRDVLIARCDSERANGALRDPLSRHANAIALLYMGPTTTHDSPSGINTLNNMRLELSAARSRVTGEPGGVYYYGSRWVDLVKERAKGAGSLAVRAFHEAQKANSASALIRVYPRFLPNSLLADTAADWTLWEGPKPQLLDSQGAQ